MEDRIDWKRRWILASVHTPLKRRRQPVIMRGRVADYQSNLYGFRSGFVLNMSGPEEIAECP